MSQDSKDLEIKGNWYPGFLGNSDERYTEFFINEAKIYYFNVTNESFHYSDFYIKDSALYLKRELEADFENMGLIYTLKDTLYVHNEEGKSLFLKQLTEPNLEQYINEEISLDEFFKAYIKRATYWNERKFR